MAKSKDATTHADISLEDAINNRQSIRDFEDKPIDREIIDSLIHSAVRAPTAMHEEPWAFAVIEDKSMLKNISDMAKVLMEEAALKNPDSQQVKFDLEILNRPNFNIFYNASTMIVIYSKFPGAFVAADCWLAAENLMLSAYAHGLGSCTVALAINPLNSIEVKEKLGISGYMTAIAPIIIGWPAEQPSKSSRENPEVYFYQG